MKKILITLLLFAGLALAISYFSGVLPWLWFEEPPTNLLIIVSDALRADVLACYGGTAHTPNLDWLANNGTLFETWYSTTPWTLPSSVVMFTGNYPTSYNRITEDSSAGKTREVYHVPDQENLLAESLKAEGYDARMLLQNSLPERSNNLQGFEALEVSSGTPEQRKHLETISGLPATGFKQIFTLMEYLLGLKTRQSFCSLIWIIDPHDQYDPPDKFKISITVDPAKLSRKKRVYPHFQSQALNNQGASFNEADRRYLKALYIAELESVDERVGYILEVLRHKDLLHRTLIVFTSDHGECFGEHGFYTHGHNYHEEVMRVPMIITGPGVPKGRRIPNACSHLGLMPTLKELLGLSFDDRFQGRSYVPLLRGESMAEEPHYLVASHQKHYREAILIGDHKLMVNKRGAVELFDLEADPGERRNIANRHPELVDRLMRRITEFRAVNQQRMVENKRLDPDLDLNKEGRKTEEQMKALGYLE